MQTFLPYSDFKRTAEVLDYRRLGKQRVEAKQILMALRGETTGWVNHPATKMWRGYEPALAAYGMEICREWIRRGYKDSLLPYFTEHFLNYMDNNEPTMPWFVYNLEFQRAHQSNLLRKDPEFYGAVFDGVPADLPYIWEEEK